MLLLWVRVHQYCGSHAAYTPAPKQRRQDVRGDWTLLHTALGAQLKQNLPFNNRRKCTFKVGIFGVALLCFGIE